MKKGRHKKTVESDWKKVVDAIRENPLVTDQQVADIVNEDKPEEEMITKSTARRIRLSDDCMSIVGSKVLVYKITSQRSDKSGDEELKQKRRMVAAEMDTVTSSLLKVFIDETHWEISR